MLTPETEHRGLFRRFFIPDLRSAGLTPVSWRRQAGPAAMVALGIVAFTFFFSWFTIARAHNFNAGWYDLGIMTQTVWRVGHGLGFTFTNPEIGPGGVHGWTALRTTIHADYLLALLAPLSWFGQTAELLLIVQSLVVGVGAWFVWRITTRLIGQPWLGAIMAWVYLWSPPLQFATIFEFHAVTLAITFILAAVDNLLAGRDRAMWVWIGLALLTKENVGITVGLLMFILAWWQGRRRMAWWALTVSWAWTAIQIGLVIPLSRPGLSSSFTNKFYTDQSDGGLSIIHRLASPTTAWHKLATATHLHSAFQLLLPLGLVLPLLSPIILVLIPELLLYWLSDSPNQQTVVLHYHALLIPIMLLAALLSWRAWRLGWGHLRWWRGAVDGLWIALMVGGVVLAQVRFGPLPWGGQTRWPLVAWKEHLTPQVHQMLRLVPPRANVATMQNLGVQLAERPIVYLLPSGLTHAEYIVVLERSFDPTFNTNDKRLAEKVMLDRLIPWLDSSTAYRQLYHQDRVYLYQRLGSDPRPLPAWPAGLLGQ